MKPILDYNIVNGQTPEGESYIRPAIVNRDSPNDLEQILKNAIDRGLIAGLKDTACASIAEGLAEQMYKELSDGHSVQFGDFFSIHLYLDGQTDGSGTLSEGANRINPRFQKGAAFDLSVGDFKMHYTDDGTRPSISLVKSEGDDSESGHLTAGEDVLVFGANLKPAEGQTLEVVFQREVDGEIEETCVDEFKTVGENLIKFAYPQLPATATYRVVATFEDTETGRIYPSNARTVECEESAAALEIASVTMQGSELPADTVDFGSNDEAWRIAIPGATVADLAGATVKADLIEGGEVVATITPSTGSGEGDPVTPADGCIDAVFAMNDSSRPDGDWWGQPCRVTVTLAGGEELTHGVTFAAHQ